MENNNFNININPLETNFEINKKDTNVESKKYSQRDLSFLLCGNENQELTINVNFSEKFLIKAWEALEKNLDLSDELFHELEDQIKLVYKREDLVKEVGLSHVRVERINKKRK